MDLNSLTISEVARGLREKKISSEEITLSCLKAIEEKDSKINAFITVDREGALKTAKKIDKKFAAGDNLSILAGVPVSIKDIFNTKGVKSTCASPILRDFVPPYDATVIERLKENGMVMIGKTNMDEFACGASTEHSCFGVTRNPHDLERVSGGSSGGSAASVSADMCIYSLGTDTGGSIRQPASFCGVHGLKVSYGRVSRSGVTSMASSWDTIGPFAKSTKDIATVLQVIAGNDRRDLTTLPNSVPNYSDSLSADIKGMTIGLPKEYFSDGVDVEITEAIKKTVNQLQKRGVKVKEVSLPYTKYAVSVYYITMPAELSANLERFDAIRYGKIPEEKPENLIEYYFNARGEGFGDEIKRRIMIGTYVLSAGYYDAYYKRAMKVRTKIIEDFRKVFEEVDVLVAPVSPYTAFKVGEKIDDPLSMYMSDALTIPANAAGIPALSVPVAKSKDGLPIGMQIIAPQFQEIRCLQLGNAVDNLQ